MNERIGEAADHLHTEVHTKKFLPIFIMQSGNAVIAMLWHSSDSLPELLMHDCHM